MKVEYKAIVGVLTLEDPLFHSCMFCCFDDYGPDCIPYSICNCYHTIFKKSESEVFKL